MLIAAILPRRSIPTPKEPASPCRTRGGGRTPAGSGTIRRGRARRAVPGTHRVVRRLGSLGASAMAGSSIVSVAVAVRGRPDDLAATLAAVRAQALPDPEATVETLVVHGPGESVPALPAGD